MKIAKVTDRMLEAAVVPSFTRIGPLVRRRLFDWTPLDSYDLSGTFVAITGATSGLGLAAAQQFVTMGADVVMISRNETKALEVAATIGTGPGRIHHLTADMGDLDQVRAAVGGLREITDRLDVLIHNAGALINPRRTTDDGSELTVRVQVVSPYLLTGLLLDPLRRASPGRVLTMSSGGMYTSGLTVDRLEMPPARYKGAEQYARAKRAQVTLNEMWAARTDIGDIRFHAVHPGWADTPGVEAAIPGFGKVIGPLLRTPAEGADTLAWLAADDGEPLATNGSFWLDRQIRPIHRLKRTRATDTPDRRTALWEWVSGRAGWDLD